MRMSATATTRTSAKPTSQGQSGGAFASGSAAGGGAAAGGGGGGACIAETTRVNSLGPLGPSGTCICGAAGVSDGIGAGWP